MLGTNNGKDDSQGVNPAQKVSKVGTNNNKGLSQGVKSMHQQ
jgi:hypothetical protein